MENIEEGFEMDRTLTRIFKLSVHHVSGLTHLFSENIRSTWENLPKTKTGEVRKVTGDYDERVGICHKPLTLRVTFSFTITHKVNNKASLL